MMGAFEAQLFMASITVHCPRCNSDRTYRHGKTPAGHVRYRCPAPMSFNSPTPMRPASLGVLNRPGFSRHSVAEK